MPSLWLVSIASCLLYFIVLAVYRLYLSPIAYFPGSKFTAISGWYETYLDVFKGGQFTFQIQKWHEKYGEGSTTVQSATSSAYSLYPGPIIRINPTEIHISDPDFYDTAYSSSTPFNKIPAFRDRFGLPTAVLSTVDHELHRHRRAALNPYFSKKQIREFSPHIQHCAERLCDRLLKEYKGTSKVVTLNDAWAAYTTDIIFFYSFAWTYDFLDFPDFIAPFTESTKALASSVHFAGHFPWALKALQSMPDVLLGVINPGIRPAFKFLNVRS